MPPVNYPALAPCATGVLPVTAFRRGCRGRTRPGRALARAASPVL